MEYDPSSDQDEQPFPSFREALEPYLTADDPGPYAKLSISVPEKAPRHRPRGRGGVRRHGQRRGGGVAPPARGRGRAGQARCGARGGSRREPRVGPCDGPDGRKAPRGRRVVASPRRGDVHLVQFEDLGGHVLRGPHPAVVVSTDRLNRAGGTVLVCSMTTKARRVAGDWLPPYLVPVSRSDSGLDRDGFVKCDRCSLARSHGSVCGSGASIRTR